MLVALDQLKIGVCILDKSGRIVIANEEFHLKQEHDSSLKTRINGELYFTSMEKQTRFSQLKLGIQNHGKFGARPRKEAITTTTDSQLFFELAPLHKVEAFGNDVFDGYILFCTDTARTFPCNTTLLKQAYGLTDTELELVNAIAEGYTNTQIAIQRQRSVQTVNAQVKSILSKTFCANRTQFLRLMMSFGTDYILNH